MKKYFAVFLAILCLLGTMTACGEPANAGSSTTTDSHSAAEGTGNSTENAPADSGSDSAAADIAAPVWAELEPEAGILVVTLPAAADTHYGWEASCSDAAVAELLTNSTENGSYVASFRGMADGECTITFSYTCMGSVAEQREITVRVAQEKIAGVLAFAEHDLGGIQPIPVTPELQELYENNALSQVFAAHRYMTQISETWHMENGVEVWDQQAVAQYTCTDGGMWFEQEAYGEEGTLISAEAYYINDGLPGAYYNAVPGGRKAMTLIPADEYTAHVEASWLSHTCGMQETLTETIVDDAFSSSVIITEAVDSSTGLVHTFEYFVDSATGLITGINQTDADMISGDTVSITRSNILYDEPRLMETVAAMEILSVEDPCYLTLVINPGAADEETQHIKVAKPTDVSLSSHHVFQLFYDYDCQQPMDVIDVDQNKFTVYAVMER